MGATSLGLSAGAWPAAPAVAGFGACASGDPAARKAAATRSSTCFCRFMMNGPPDGCEWRPRHARRNYIWWSHFPVPVLGLLIGRTEHFQMPFAAAPGLDDLGGDDVHENLRKCSPLGIALEVIRLFL